MTPLAKFGSLTRSVYSSNYSFSLSNDFAMNTLLKTFGKANFATQVIGGSQAPEMALENTAEDGHVKVLS